MNIKITKEQHLELCKFEYHEFLFGSRLHETNNENSDYDYVRMISNEFYNSFDTIAVFLPNIHNFQYDNEENNSQYIWMTEQQFYSNLFSGDGHVASDIILFNDNFKVEDKLFLTRTYKNIKGYLGLAKRDIKFYDKNEKKANHVIRSLHIAACLLENIIPQKQHFNSLYSTMNYHGSREVCQVKLDELRIKMNTMYEKNELTLYPNFEEQNSIIQLLTSANNIKEFKYD